MPSQSKYARRLRRNPPPAAGPGPDPAAGVEPAHAEVRQTADGSYTLFVPELDEHYHSRHGARQESAHVFIRHGLWPVLRAGAADHQATLRILEVGLGTGLNVLLTAEACQQAAAYTVYDALETRPLPPAVVAALAYEYCFENRPEPDWRGQLLHQLHRQRWNDPAAPALVPDFHLHKRLEGLETAALPAAEYHLIYFDAFAPDKQPELWTEAIFRKLHAATRPGGVLVTYCAQGQFRRNLRAAGWCVEKLPGPPGKREMTRAVKLC
ncbi:tRNA (5-methylaminomethyl-2-thiouridine)(34)-methyltransferase MnmD [Hymenobacter sp.]|uniref:tRNA (5-methylaminomethyl-2-thiouridine)(34)-methyltransferase MnmD n=1 Tax=Hymenobacter sp. TaxID=1898978 RepID=UPI00286CAF88|nr:tRNA (5-methylaminomethyl-2-thiouridine)(34)-methyltransferase MnmD [Hymenobacter sp.]